MRTLQQGFLFKSTRVRRVMATIAALILTLAVTLGLLGPRRVLRASARRLERGWLIATARLVDVGGHRLHLERQGTGSPTVVFDAGLCQ
jgi:hypothetical protein